MMISNLSTIPQRPRAAALTVALLALAASFAGIGNRFAYDDVPLVATNDRIHDMHAWWTRFAEPYWPEAFAHVLYRPVTTLGFTVQWTLGAGSPFVFHGVSIALYVACVVGVLLLARELLSAPWAWLAAALFAVHPVHVEAVGNVVGQSELLAGIACVLGAWRYIRARRRAQGLSAREIAIVATLYAIGLLSKESAIVLPALILAAELTVLKTRDAALPTPQRGWLVTIGLLAMIAIGSLALRRAVIGAWLGDYPVPALKHLSAGERVLTMLAASREWIRLLVWPSRLSFSYSPPYLPIVTSPTPQILFGVGLLLVIIISIAVTYRRAPAIPFGLLWFAIALLPVSNLLFISGVFVAERTLFMPSVGFLIAVAGALELLWPRVSSVELRRGLVAPIAFLLLAGTIRSAIRQRDWFDTAHIATAGVRAVPDAYTVNALYGEYLATRRAAGSAEKWLRRSIALFPHDPEPVVELGNLYVDAKQWAAAQTAFRKALEIDPSSSSARAGLVLCLVQANDYSAARHEAEVGVERGESADTFRRLIVAIDSAAKTR